LVIQILIFINCRVLYTALITLGAWKW